MNKTLEKIAIILKINNYRNIVGCMEKGFDFNIRNVVKLAANHIYPSLEEKISSKFENFDMVLDNISFRVPTSGRYNYYIIPINSSRGGFVKSFSCPGERYSNKCRYKKTDCVHIFFIPNNWNSSVFEKGISIIKNNLILSAKKKKNGDYNIVYCNQGIGFKLNLFTGILKSNGKIIDSNKIYVYSPCPVDTVEIKFNISNSIDEKTDDTENLPMLSDKYIYDINSLHLEILDYFRLLYVFLYTNQKNKIKNTQDILNNIVGCSICKLRCKSCIKIGAGKCKKFRIDLSRLDDIYENNLHKHREEKIFFDDILLLSTGVLL